jgi:hypothetical protein
MNGGCSKVLDFRPLAGWHAQTVRPYIFLWGHEISFCDGLVDGVSSDFISVSLI